MADPEFEVGLLRGFRFACRPDCGLCCYTSPQVAPDEWRRLREVRPELTAVRAGGSVCVPARSNGGACVLLTENRCSVHAVRPHPCREFPISVHVGHRLQASVVLSCPGIGLDGLVGDREDREPSGFDAELLAVRTRIGREGERRVAEAARRRRKIRRVLEAEGRWEEEEPVRQWLGDRIPLPSAGSFPPDPPPPIDEPWEFLPMYFDGRAGPVALGSREDGWEAVELAPTGGGSPLGVAVPPDRPPKLDEGARELLEAYLRYWLARDAFFGTLHVELLDRRPGTVREEAERTLREIGAATVATSYVRAQFRRGPPEELRRDDLERGIRAVDLDWLDRASWGGRL